MNKVSENGNGDNGRFLGIAGKTAVVTGGAVNIGAAVSRRMAELGVKTAICYNSSSAPAAKLAAEIRKLGGAVEIFQMDVSDDRQVGPVFDRITEAFGGIDILVNNSGIFSTYSQAELEASEWQRLFNINAMGVFLCSKAAAARMNCGGIIINIASINALHPGFGNTAHYDAAKGAVHAYTRSLAAELGPRGIRVNAIAPGLVEEEGLRTGAPALAEMVEVRNPLKNSDGKSRLVSTGDVADAAVFLASALASSVTGETLVVDRGYLLT